VSAFYLTTPIYYVNARPHLGHAYTTIVADAMARYHRSAGDDTFLLTGTDEHGDKIAQAAASANVSPQAYTDEIAGAYREAWRRLGITHDDFIRTTEGRHKKVVQAILQRLWEAGEIYLGRYGGNYCVGCERFYTEKEIVDGKCPDHQTPLTWIEEENYFFKMSKYQGWLIEYVNAQPDRIQPERYRNEILGFLRDPLQDLSISRPRTRLQWGIPLPFDDKYVTYVWFDALINYVSALDWPDGDRFARYWPVVHHVIGKDILKPHAIYWPCMLKAAGLDVYRHLFVHGYWNVGGGKMSKTVGNVVEAFALADKYGNDAFRYFVMREMTFGLDSDFSEDAFVGRLNADLANDLGNLASRATTLLEKAEPASNPSPLAEVPGTAELHAASQTALAGVQRAMKEFAFQRALAAIWELIGAANRYVDSTQPWALAKDPARAGELNRVLVTLADTLRFLGIVLDPFLPGAALKIRVAVNDDRPPRLANAVMGRINDIPRVQKLSGLFPRIDDGRKERASGAPATSTSPPSAQAGRAPLATMADFGKVELRVAQVLAAEAVPKSRKLLKLTVTLGSEERTIVAGIAQHYAPADLVGKKVVVVANLEPAKLMGIQSQGMVLAGSTGDDSALAVLVLDRDLPPGARVK
jgi:methionyl-tRNA synthetase